MGGGGGGGGGGGSRNSATNSFIGRNLAMLPISSPKLGMQGEILGNAPNL